MTRWLAGKIWFYKIEGLPCYNGINVYPKNDPISSGFVLKAGPLHFKARYSKRIQQWIVYFYWSRSSDTRYSI